MSHPSRRVDRYHFAVLGVLLVALALRLHGQNWDQGIYLHPDERFIAIVATDRVTFPPLDDLGSLFDPAHSPINPRRDGPDGRPLSFAYGALPLYTQGVASWLVGGLTGTDQGDYAHLYRVGRTLSTIADLLTLVFLILMARRLFGRTAAVIAGALYAFAPLPIQLSHFFTVDVWVNCFVTASLCAAIHFYDRPGWRRALLVGVPVGGAFATKASVPSLLLPLAIAFGWVIWSSSDRLRAVGLAAGAGLVALAIFSIFEPYALVRPVAFFNDIGTQARIVRGQFDVPFTRQFVGLTPGAYELRNWFAYALGPGFVLAAFGGVVSGARRFWRRRELPLAIALAWIVAYIPTLLITEARFLRYSLPLAPIFAVLAGGWLASWRPRALPRLAPVAVTLALAITAVWGLGFSSVYDQENSRIAASKWMVANIPAGSVVTAEEWDDALPLPYPGAPPLQFTQLTFDIYGDEAPTQKAESIAKVLEATDYVVLSSDRLVDSVDNLPWRYAVQDEYYRRLVNGQLGFQLVYEGNVQPGLLRLHIDDSDSDESFTVYDHPHVRIFKKVQALSDSEIHDRLLWGINQPWSPTRYPPRKQLLLSQPVETFPTTDDAGWNALAVDHAWLAIVVWLLAVEACGLAALPLAAAVLRRAPDRGVLSSRLLGLLIVGWIGWFAASTSLWSSTALHIGLALAFVGALSWGVALTLPRAGQPLPLPTPRAWLGWSSIWFALFGLFLLFRAVYPDFWQTYYGGEKPFELAYLRAISHSLRYPPYDPWYADGTINYYYYGWHLVASLIKLSGVGVSYGFQLGSATFAGLLGCQAVTLAGMLARRGNRRLRLSYVAATGLLGLLAVELIGNLDAFRQMLTLNGSLTQQFDFWRSTRVIDFTINEFPYFSELWADLHPHVINFPIIALLLTLLTETALDARRPRATIRAWLRAQTLPAVLTALTLGSVAVTNSWDAPLGVALALLCFGYVGLTRSWQRGMLGLAVGGCVALAAFALFFPFYRGFYSVVQGVNLTDSGSNLAQFLTVWGIFDGVVAIALVARLAASWRSTADPRDGAAFGFIALAAGLLAHVTALLLGRHGSLSQSLIALAITSAVVAAAASIARPARLRLLLLEPVVALTVAAALASVYRPAAAVALSFATASLMLVLPVWRRPSDALPWAFVGIGSAVIALTEFVYVADDLQHSEWERMNTVFKFYLPSWTLLALASAVLLARLWQASRAASGWHAAHAESLGFVARPAAPPDRRVVDRPHAHLRRPARGFALAGACLLALGLAYPLAGTPARFQQDIPTTPSTLSLDGYSWMRGGSIVNATGQTIGFTGDLEAIEWLNANVSGSPTILEASIGPYRGNGSRISSATGLPTVLGWDRHQRQQRYQSGIDARLADVRAIYNQTDPAQKLEALRRYNVRYVIVGDVERYWNTEADPRPYASEAGLQEFDALVGAGLRVVFDQDGTTIYGVDDFARIAPAPNATRDP